MHVHTSLCLSDHTAFAWQALGLSYAADEQPHWYKDVLGMTFCTHALDFTQRCC